MRELRAPHQVSVLHLRYILLVALLLIAPSGCSRFVKNRVSVTPFIEPKVEADTTQLIVEVNRMAQVRSLRGKIDLQFLDNSFARCGVAEKYRTSQGDLILQRTGQIYLSINAPFGIKIAEMASDGAHFEVAVFQGDDRYKRFVRGTNEARYARLEGEGAGEVDCGEGGRKRTVAMQQRAVGALSGLRPQHLTDALLVRPIAAPPTDLIYTRAEAFNEVADDRPNAKPGARVVRSYYTLEELAPEGPARARLLRRFWFDRSERLQLARMQTFDERGYITTDVVYKNPQPFGADPQLYTLPADIELTRPLDRYSIRISYQTPAEVKVDQPFEPDIFVLQNKSGLPEVNLDANR